MHVLTVVAIQQPKSSKEPLWGELSGRESGSIDQDVHCAQCDLNGGVRPSSYWVGACVALHGESVHQEGVGGGREEALSKGGVVVGGDTLDSAVSLEGGSGIILTVGDKLAL